MANNSLHANVFRAFNVRWSMMNFLSCPCLYLLPESVKGESLDGACACWRVLTERREGGVCMSQRIDCWVCRRILDCVRYVV